MLRALATLLVLVGVGRLCHAEAPWRLGAPEVVWRYEPAAGTFYAHLATLSVHPEGGVVAVARAVDASPLRYGMTLVRLSASGTKLWERSLVIPEGEQYAHLTFLRRRATFDTIVTSSTQLTVLGPAGAVRWTRSAAQVGIAGLGVAIAGRTRAGDRIIVGGEGDNGRGVPVPMVAGLADDGTRRWLAVGPWPRNVSPPPVDEVPGVIGEGALPLDNSRTSGVRRHQHAASRLGCIDVI